MGIYENGRYGYGSKKEAEWINAERLGPKKEKGGLTRFGKVVVQVSNISLKEDKIEFINSCIIISESERDELLEMVCSC